MLLFGYFIPRTSTIPGGFLVLKIFTDLPFVYKLKSQQSQILSI